MDTNESQGDVVAALALGRQIAAERTGAGLSQRELAERIGISKVALGRYERGDRDVPMTVVRDVARAVGLRASELLRSAEDRAERES